MAIHQWSVGGSPEEVLALLESLPVGERIHTWTVEEAINSLTASIELRNKILAEQEIHIGQGGKGSYFHSEK